MSVSNASRIELLNKENYDTWKIQMEALLIRSDLWGYVSGILVQSEIIEEDQNSKKEFEKWIRNDGKAKSEIILSMSSSELKQVKGCVTSRDVWIKLENIYQSKGPARKATLLKKLILHRMLEGSDVRDHISEFFDAVDKLIEIEVEINPDLLAIMLLYSLPSSFENFRCAIESRDQLPTPETLRVKIVEENDARKNEARSLNQDVMLVNRRRNNWRYENNKSSESNVFKYRCHRCRKIGHKASECKVKVDNKQSLANCYENVTLLNSEANHVSLTERKMNWCLDSGATSHLCNDINSFVEINKSVYDELNLANNSSTGIMGRGTVKLTADVFGEYKDFTLNNTLHVPDLRTNLLSVGKITNNGFEVLFKKDSAQILDNEGNIKLKADRVGDLYYTSLQLQDSAFISQTSDIMLWHRRLGHLNFKDLSKSIRNGFIRGINVDTAKESNFECDICCQGKMTRNTFPKKSERKTKLLEMIHTDVCGPMRTESLGKAKYFVEFIDDHSRWCEVRFIRSKSEVVKKTKEFIAMIERQKGKSIKCIQSDNGTEYVNKEFDDLLKEHGITRRLTVAYNPEQNGVAERKNRTLISTARCLLIQSGLSPSFWAEAVNTANYIRNRCPTSSLNGKTPYEMWNGNPPDVSNFKEFGCKVFCLNREPGKSKFDARGREGVFLGYSEQTKGYKIWLTNEKKVEITRDVKFLERNINLTGEFSDFEPEEEVCSEPCNVLMETEMSNIENQIEFDDVLEPCEVLVNNEMSNIENQVETNDDNTEEQNLVRGRGRPRILRTGLKGRPQKKYNMVPDVTMNVEVEEVFVSEVSMKQALSSPDVNEWYEAMASEISSIIKNNTWILVDRPKSQEVIGSRIVLRNKYKADGALERRKARLVAQGFSQQPGVHFNQTFAPVARISSIRLITALAAQYGMKIHQLDVTCAYLNGELEETIYMNYPKQFPEILDIICKQNCEDISEKAANMLDILRRGDKVCLLKKSLYGLRQAGRSWYTKLNKFIQECGAKPTNADPCMYYIGQGEDITLIAIYVDDILIASRNAGIIMELVQKFSVQFEVKNLGNVGYCLGIEFTQDENIIALHQRGYIMDILNRFGMTDCKALSTPLDPNVKLSKTIDVLTDEEEKLPYRELIGALTYLAVTTRPDISFAVSYLGQFNNCYRKSHWIAAKRVLRYLKGTVDVGLIYRPVEQVILKGYVDADWGNCPDDRRSYTGFTFILSGCPISWDSRKQRTVALSSTEAEYMGMTEIAKESIYLRNFLSELGFNELIDVQVFNDNMSALKLAENPTFHARSKHIDIRYHFIRDALENELLKLYHVSTDDMISDILTKSLPRMKHEKCVNMMGLRRPKKTLSECRSVSRGSVGEHRRTYTTTQANFTRLAIHSRQ